MFFSQNLILLGKNKKIVNFFEKSSLKSDLKWFCVWMKCVVVRVSGRGFVVDLHLELGLQSLGQDPYLTMKSEWAPCMICFSERMCSCCLVSTMWRFLRIFIAKVLDSSLFNWTLKKGRRKSENDSSVNTQGSFSIPN